MTHFFLIHYEFELYRDFFFDLVCILMTENNNNYTQITDTEQHQRFMDLHSVRDAMQDMMFVSFDIAFSAYENMLLKCTG